MRGGSQESDAELQELLEHFDHHCPAFANHRLELYARMHEGCPALRSDRHGGFWFFGDYQSAVEIQRDTETYSNRQLTLPVMSVPPLIPGAFEELLRTNGPVQAFVKTAVTQTEIDGVQLQADEVIVVGYGAANLDPTQFPDPEKIDFRRAPNNHTSLGIGPHRCLGAHLAKAVVCTTLEYLLDKAPDYRIVEERLASHDDIATNFGYYSVPVLKS